MRYSVTTVAAVPGGSAVTTRGAIDVDVVGVELRPRQRPERRWTSPMSLGANDTGSVPPSESAVLGGTRGPVPLPAEDQGFAD